MFSSPERDDDEARSEKSFLQTGRLFLILNLPGFSGSLSRVLCLSHCGRVVCKQGEFP